MLFSDRFRSLITRLEHPISRILLNILDLDITGIYIIGGEKQTIYNFAKKKNLKLKATTKQGIPNMLDDVSMNINKLNNIKYDKSV